MASSIEELLAVDAQSEPDHFGSRHLPMAMGNSMPIAYGGFTIAIALSACCTTVRPNFHPYSILGHFLGPASTQEHLFCSVIRTRDTKTFATRRITVTQKDSEGRVRQCLELIVDFHVEEASVLSYSVPPLFPWPSFENCPEVFEHMTTLQERNQISDAQLQEVVRSMGSNHELFETRYCLNSISSQNASGVAKGTPTIQDHLPITSKVSAEWYKGNSTPSNAASQAAALAFLMDGGLSFLPLAHNHMWFEDVGACSTLDFALRIFAPGINMGDWHLKERTTIQAGQGRTFSESKLRNTRGELVASMSQQCILRVKKFDTRSSL